MRSRLYKYGAAMLAGLLAACGKTPDGVLSEKQMQAVQLDMQLAEAMISVDSRRFEDSLRRAELFQSVFRKHGITQAEYDSSLVWYGRNLDIFMDVYDRILKDLDERQNALGDVQVTASPAVAAQDSTDIWPRRPFLRLEPHTAVTTFDIRPETGYSSGSFFVLGMSVWGMEKAMAHRPEIRICAEQGDTTVVIRDTVACDGYHETLLKTIPTRRVSRVYGYFFLNNKDLHYYKVYIDGLTLMKYNYGREITSRKVEKLHRADRN